MSVKLNSTGGGSVTLDSPSTASNYTVTLPSAAGTLATTTGTGSVFTNPTINGFTGDTSAITVGTTQFVKDTSGNIGIGTASPLAKLSIGSGTLVDANVPIQMNAAAGSGVAYIGFNNAGGYGLLVGYDNAVGYARIRNISNTSLAFSTNDTERMRIDSSGNLLVGTTSQILAGSKLSISGSGSAGQGPISLVNTSSSTKKWYCGPDSGGSFVVFNDALTGAYLAYGGTTWLANVSDARLKNKIDDIKDAVSAISKLNPLTFYFKNEPNEGIPRYGFFAQNVGDAIPDAMLVSPQEDVELGEVYTYDASIINVYLVKAIQELSAQNQALEARLAKLEAK